MLMIHISTNLLGMRFFLYYLQTAGLSYTCHLSALVNAENKWMRSPDSFMVPGLSTFLHFFEVIQASNGAVSESQVVGHKREDFD